MHPDLMLDIVNQRSREARARAEAARVGWAVRKLRHAQRDLTKVSGRFGLPEIPNHVADLLGREGHESGDAGHVPAQRAA